MQNIFTRYITYRFSIIIKKTITSVNVIGTFSYVKTKNEKSDNIENKLTIHSKRQRWDENLKLGKFQSKEDTMKQIKQEV